MFTCCWHSPMPQGLDHEYPCCNATGIWAVELHSDTIYLCSKHLKMYQQLGYTPRVYRPVPHPLIATN